MFSKAEQICLLELLKAKRTKKDYRLRTSHFYKTMESLVVNDYVFIRHENPRIYQLTILGECMASIIAKHTKTDPKFLKYAGTVELFLFR